MTSVTRFLKQVDSTNKYYPVAPTTLANLAGTAFEFIPASGNVVANYAPGAVVQASASAGASTGAQTLYYAIANAASVMGVSTSGILILRDMGKTISAPTATTEANGIAGTYTTQLGYYRQVQLMAPSAAAAGQIGGTTGSAFGVLGSSPAYSPYITFYVPTIVMGILGASSLSSILLIGTQGTM